MEYFEELLNAGVKRESGRGNREARDRDDEADVEGPLEFEHGKEVIRDLKNNKCLGEDGIGEKRLHIEEVSLWILYANHTKVRKEKNVRRIVISHLCTSYL